MQDGAPSDVAERMFLEQLALIESVTTSVCARNHLSPFDIDDFSSLVKLRLIEDNYSVLRQFEGRSSLRTFLTIVIQHLFLDYRDRAWGKWRPSAVAKRAGAVGLLLERLTKRDGYTVDQAFEVLKTQHHVQTSRAELDQVFATLPERRRLRREPEASAAEVPATTLAPDEGVEAREREEAARRIGDVMRRLLERIDPQDRLLLTLRFHDGYAVSDIARMLRIDQKRLYRRFDRLLKDLRTRFSQEGIESPAATEAFDSLLNVEWQQSDWASDTMEGTGR